jgi:hypothetical protein
MNGQSIVRGSSRVLNRGQDGRLESLNLRRIEKSWRILARYRDLTISFSQGGP